jgi:selenide,water dikinase
MLRPGQGAVLSLAALPALPGALAQLEAGRRSTMHEPNAQGAFPGQAAGPRYDLLFDPQTSGGLLLGVAQEAAPALLAALRAAGYAEAAIIGDIVDREGQGEAIVCC